MKCKHYDGNYEGCHHLALYGEGKCPRNTDNHCNIISKSRMWSQRAMFREWGEAQNFLLCHDKDPVYQWRSSQRQGWFVCERRKWMKEKI